VRRQRDHSLLRSDGRAPMSPARHAPQACTAGLMAKDASRWPALRLGLTDQDGRLLRDSTRHGQELAKGSQHRLRYTSTSCGSIPSRILVTDQPGATNVSAHDDGHWRASAGRLSCAVRTAASALGLVAVGIPELLVGFAILVLIVFGVWRSFRRRIVSRRDRRHPSTLPRSNGVHREIKDAPALN
jgi:hypothetical protein